jgi:hypothetical protein
MHAHGHGDFQFCADAIRAGDEHGLFPFFAVEREERAEAADAAEDAGCEGVAGVMPDALLDVVRDSDIHPSIGIFHEKPVRFRFHYRFGQSSRPAVHFEEFMNAAVGGGVYFQLCLIIQIN